MGIQHSNQKMFLSWFNEFLSIERFAEYWGISEKLAKKTINKGRIIHESQFSSIFWCIGH